jgi:hypothetical protein
MSCTSQGKPYPLQSYPRAIPNHQERKKRNFHHHRLVIQKYDFYQLGSHRRKPAPSPLNAAVYITSAWSLHYHGYPYTYKWPRDRHMPSQYKWPRKREILSWRGLWMEIVIKLRLRKVIKRKV